MPEIACVNGRFCPIEQAVVPIDDRGFQFADAVYEVVAVYGGQAFRLEQHLQRLARSLSLIDMDMASCGVDLRQLVRDGVRRCGLDPCIAYLQVTRGVQPRSHVYRDEVRPTVVATFRAKPVIDASLRQHGVKVRTVPETRWARCEIKSTALLANVLEKNRAVRGGYYDAVFVDAAGCVREATASNVFAVRDGALITPAADASILHGVTREYVLECAMRSGVPIEEADLTAAQLRLADEVFLSSTTMDVLAVTQVDDQPISTGRPGPVTRSLYDAYLHGVQSLNRLNC